MINFQQITGHDYNSSTASSVIAKAFRLAGTGTDTEMFPTANMLQWLKDAINEINLRDVFYFQDMEGEFTLHDGETDIALPSTLKRHIRLREYADDSYGTTYTFVLPRLYTGVASTYTVKGNTLIVPAVSGTIVFRLDYIGGPVEIVNETDVTLLPTRFDKAMILLLVSNIKFAEGMMSDGHKFQSDFNNEITKLKYDSYKRNITPVTNFGVIKTV